MKAQVRFRKGFAVILTNQRAQAATMVIPVGGKEGGKDNNHRGADQWMFVVSGRGSATVDGKTIALKANTLVLIERGQNHEVRNKGTTNLVTLNFYLPPAYTQSGKERPTAKPE